MTPEEASTPPAAPGETDQPSLPEADPTKTHEVKAIKHDSPLISCRFDPTGRFVFVSRTDSPRSRADSALAKMLFDGVLDLAVVGKNQMTTVRNKQTSADRGTGFLHGFDFLDERQGIQHHAITDDARGVRMKDSGRHQMQHMPAAADDHCMSGVMSTLVAGHAIEPLGQDVDDLALAFVSPLRADDCQVHVRVG